MLLLASDMIETSALLRGIPEISPDRQLIAVTARELLLGQFTLAEVPITGRRVGCVIEIDGGDLVAGHNVETENPPGFFHAEANTLDSMPAHLGSTGIRAVYMAGQDPKLTGQQLKNITPCTDCYGLLGPKLTPDAELILFQPNTLEHATVFAGDEFRPAYGKWPYSAIEATSRTDIVEELQEKTELSETDREVVADLRIVGRASDIEFYLTGSASGRGWMSSVINRKLGNGYGDMDILAITDRYGEATLVQITKEILATHYNDLETVTTETDFWVVCGDKRGTERHVRYVSFMKNDKKIMDFTWATSLKDGMLRDDYYDNNCYHKIS